MTETQYDVVIVGGGPAGLTAALYTARRALRTLIISKDLGGQAATTTVIENYPGVGAIDGFELMEKFRDQAVQYGAEFRLGEIDAINRLEDWSFTLRSGEDTISAQAVILAFGLTPRSLAVPGETKFTGKGVSYSTAAVLSTLKDKRVVIVGGGNSAIEAVNTVSPLAQHVYLVHRRDRFRAEAILVEQLGQLKNVTQCLNAQVSEIKGGQQVTGVTILYNDKRTEELAVDAVCVHVGFMSKTNFIEQLVALNEKHEIIIQPDHSTNTPGLFAAGDVTVGRQKQVVVSAGEGCKAALSCYTYLMERSGQEVKVDQDWQVKTGTHFIRT